MPEGNKTYDDLLSGEYWELYRVHDYGEDDEERDPIGYIQAGIEWENDTEDWSANPADTGVLQQFHGKSEIGLEFSGFVPYEDGEESDDAYLVKMDLVTEDGVMIGKATWEAAEVWVYNEDPSMDVLDPEPKQIIECPSFGIAYENMEYPDDDAAIIDFNAHMNSYPLVPLMVGGDVPDIGVES